MKWCFDTSALIEPWVRHYPPDLFPGLWEALTTLAEAGVIGAPIDVKIEIERQSDGLCDWVSSLSNFFVAPDRATIEAYAKIVNDYPGFLKVNSTKSGADPFVVATAEIFGVPVVTYETMAKKDVAPKIPNVCTALGIKHASLVDVLRAESVKF